MKTALWWIASVALVFFAIGLVAWSSDEAESQIPTPPPGMTYCATDTDLGFCPIGGR